MSDGPEFHIPSERIRAVLADADFDTDYYRWCDSAADWSALAQDTYSEDSLSTPQGSFAPLDVTEFIAAFRNAGADVERVRRTNQFTVSVQSKDCLVELHCRLGRGINTLSPELSVSLASQPQERKLALSGLARTAFFAKNPGASDPLYPYPIIGSRSHLEVMSKEMVEWMRRIGDRYPREGLRPASNATEQGLCVHFVVHEVFEAPGAYEDWAQSRGHAVSYTRLYEGDALPEDVGAIDLLIVMGGPQSPQTTTAECAHFDAAAEIALIRRCVDGGKAVIGVCLGAQLLGEAHGGAVEQSPHKEIGVFPIALTAEGLSHPLFDGFDEIFDSGHWHGDMPGLTHEATVLATSEGCPRQIVSYGRFSYAFQCHLEFTPACIDALIEHSESELAALAGEPYVESPADLRIHDYAPMNQRLEAFLDRLVADYSSNRVGR